MNFINYELNANILHYQTIPTRFFFMNLDYLSLREEDKLFLGTLVNHTLSLSQLLNETIE